MKRSVKREEMESKTAARRSVPHTHALKAHERINGFAALRLVYSCFQLPTSLSIHFQRKNNFLQRLAVVKTMKTITLNKARVCFETLTLETIDKLYTKTPKVEPSIFIAPSIALNKLNLTHF